MAGEVPLGSVPVGTRFMRSGYMVMVTRQARKTTFVRIVEDDKSPPDESLVGQVAQLRKDTPVILPAEADDAYEPLDPKHPTYHERMSDVWDTRDKTEE